VVGFVTAGLMTLQQSIGVIMGANVGSTVTAQIIAFNVTKYALGMIAIGFAMQFSSRGDRVRHYGSMIMGLGLIFFGMGVMGNAMAPLRSYPPFLDLMMRMETPALGILVGAVFTGLIQSSAATTGIAIVIASEGLIGLEAGIALALGANIGTCVTATLAAIGKPVEARRAALAHVLFNILGVAMWVALIPELAKFVTWLSPSHPELAGVARRAAEVPRQIANAHTVFNVANTAVFIGFTGALTRLVVWLVPERPQPERVIVRPKYLDSELVSKPALALERVRLEIGHLGEIVEAMLARVGPVMVRGDRSTLQEVSEMDDQVDVLHENILGYLGEIRRHPLSDRESDDFLILMSTSDYIESIGDVIESTSLEAAEHVAEADIEPSETTLGMFADLHEAVTTAVSSAVASVRDVDERAAQNVLAQKLAVNERIEQVLRHQARRLAVVDPNRPATFRLEMEVVDGYKRMYTLSKRIAKRVLPAAIERASVQ
jgi:phosphate:Na+ symporter